MSYLPNKGANVKSTEDLGSTGYTTDSLLQIANIFMMKTASIAFLELQGTNGKRFHFTENIMKQILLPEYAAQGQTHASVASLLLKRIHLQKIFIQPGTGNRFLFPIGLCINGIAANEYTMSGDCFNYIVPQKYTITTPVCIFESRGDESLIATWEEDFAKWNSDNLESLCDMPVPDSDIVIVHLDHPVVQLLDY